VGIPGAIGIKLAAPDKTVIGLTGDGGSLYTIQALWTAAHYNVGAKFIVCNNRSYKLLKLNIMQYWKERGIPERDFPKSFDIQDPPVEFERLSHSLGVPAETVNLGSQIKPAIQRMLAAEGPYLIDLIISTEVEGHRAGCNCGQ
jgi:benzoylformate decarboxylase